MSVRRPEFCDRERIETELGGGRVWTAAHGVRAGQRGCDLLLERAMGAFPGKTEGECGVEDRENVAPMGGRVGGRRAGNPARSVETDIVARRACAGIVGRQPRIIEQTLSEPDFGGIRGRGRWNRCDGLFEGRGCGLPRGDLRYRQTRNEHAGSKPGTPPLHIWCVCDCHGEYLLRAAQVCARCATDQLRARTPYYIRNMEWRVFRSARQVVQTGSRRRVPSVLHAGHSHLSPISDVTAAPGRRYCGRRYPHAPAWPVAIARE